MKPYAANREQFTESIRGALVTEASTIGLRAGLFPPVIVVATVLYTLVSRDENVVKYQSKDGKLMLVFNDSNTQHNLIVRFVSQQPPFKSTYVGLS